MRLELLVHLARTACPTATATLTLVISRLYLVRTPTRTILHPPHNTLKIVGRV